MQHEGLHAAHVLAIFCNTIQEIETFPTIFQFFSNFIIHLSPAAICSYTPLLPIYFCLTPAITPPSQHLSFPSSLTLLLTLLPIIFFTHPSLPLFRPLCRVYRSQLAVSADHANSPHLPLFYPPPPSQVAFAALTQSSMLIVYWLEQLRRRQEQGGSDCRSNGDCLD